jgi:hypothetical protein
MQNYLFIGGNWDGLDVPVVDDAEAVQLPKGAAGKAIYHRETLSVDDVSLAFYRHESLTPEQVIDLLAAHYKAWCVNRPGGRR